MEKLKVTIGIFLTFLFFQTCREPFEASSKLSGKDLLVVEGFINVGGGITTIKLSRVIALNTGSQLVPEVTAGIYIEDQQSNKYDLQNLNNGTYESAEINLSTQQDYRIVIKIKDKTFLSEYTTPVITPRIDSVGWKVDNHDVFVHVSTHDPLNRTLYYKWEYEEVWEVRSVFQSKWAYESGVARVRGSEEINKMSYCWPYNRNTDFLFASSESFTRDEISMFRLNRFPLTDARLGWRYSITVTQRALTAKEFEFLQIIKRNSNSLGNFFDSQPSQIFGNLYCTSSPEQVVGYIGSYTSDRKQEIIKRSAISDYVYDPPCPDGPAPVEISDPMFNTYLTYWLPIDALLTPVPGEDIYTVTGFILGRNYCVDCRIRSGNASKPNFWVKEDEGDVE